MMNNKDLQKEAENYIESNNITKNTYAIEKAYRDGAKMIMNQGQPLPIYNVSKCCNCDSMLDDNEYEMCDPCSFLISM